MTNNYYLSSKDRDHDQCHTKPHVAKVHGANGFAIRNTGILRRKDMFALKKAIDAALKDDKK